MLKYLLWVVGGLVVFAAIASAYNILAPLPTYEVKLPEVAINHQDSALLDRGAKLTTMVCAKCHRSQEDGTLKGDIAQEEGFGTFYVGNITNDPTTGIGRYSDAELVSMLRTGIKPDGRLMVPIMSRLHKMSDEDLYSIVAYLRSGQGAARPAEQAWPEPRFSFLAKALMRFAFRPAPLPEEPVVAPPISDQAAHGEYLADAVLDCYKCHSATFMTNNEEKPRESEGYYGGGNPVPLPPGEITISSNLTQHPEHGLHDWSLADFNEALRSGQLPDGTATNGAMPIFNGLTDEEIAAIWAYLQTVPVLDNEAAAN